MTRPYATIARDPVLRARALAGCPPSEREAMEAAFAEASRASHGRRASGRVAQMHGDNFEAWVERQHAEALAHGIVARVVHTGPVVVFDRRGAVHVVDAGGADWQGTLADGRSLVVEAKSRAGRLSWSQIPEHQRDDLDACARTPGLAALLYEAQGAGRYAIPWQRVPWSGRGSEGRGGIGPGDAGMERWRIGCERCYLATLLEGEATWRG